MSLMDTERTCPPWWTASVERDVSCALRFGHDDPGREVVGEENGRAHQTGQKKTELFQGFAHEILLPFLERGFRFFRRVRLRSE